MFIFNQFLDLRRSLWWEYLCQPLFSSTEGVVWHPQRFMEKQRLQFLERCWDYQITQHLESCWQQSLPSGRS
ncbi:hypothetical protein [Alkalinema sp. FACHB-956]|uniref:hypothetical protein n=1 Tax=Alkalinema sp. FACHB-956 TaxID=2692768 RepID=UPI00168A068B|nr:hypothetical protein [Alkalinema sp. FACHB-956]MBD2329202.1 hypothetical protein [Alkalinema sp. FACHB-956]